MKFHKTSGKMAASNGTKTSSPFEKQNPSTNAGAQTELPLAHPAVPPHENDHLAAYAASPTPGQEPSQGNVQNDHLAAYAALSSHENDRHEPYVTSAYISRRFNMSERTIRRNVRDYGMPAHPIGPRGVRFLVSEVQRWLDKNARKRFAATGRAVTKEELQKRIVMIPLLDGLEIVDATAKPAPPTATQLPNVAQGNALRPNPSGSNALKRQPNGSALASDYMPRCTPGRKRKTPEKVACDASHHKWSKGRYTRTCAVCGLTQKRDPNDQWVTST